MIILCGMAIDNDPIETRKMMSIYMNIINIVGPSNTGGVKYRDFEICP